MLRLVIFTSELKADWREEVAEADINSIPSVCKVFWTFCVLRGFWDCLCRLSYWLHKTSVLKGSQRRRMDRDSELKCFIRCFMLLRGSRRRWISNNGVWECLGRRWMNKLLFWRLPGIVQSAQPVFWRPAGGAGSTRLVVWQIPNSKA